MLVSTVTANIFSAAVTITETPPADDVWSRYAASNKIDWQAGGFEAPTPARDSSWPAERRTEIGIDDGLIRLSVGIEEVEDLIADLNHALTSA